MEDVEKFLTDGEEEKVIEAIQKAEKETSGEVRVHIENKHNKSAMERAKELFHILHMDNTKNDNGVLFYVSVEDKEFAIIGDKGIDDVTPDDFWENVKNRVCDEFAKGNHSDGLILGIIEAGQKLREFFPYEDDGKNELPDEITRS
ncbi:MAG: TPM domain-containing protein [Bacteroidota bacterium]